jgi:methanogenesis marker radical SAM protein
MQIYTDVGGRPGIDCGGFCKFCFYKNVDYSRIDSLNLGCVNCPPNQIGCDKCDAMINRVNNNFKDLNKILTDIDKKIFMQELLNPAVDLELIIGAGADIFYYPQVRELVLELKKNDLHLHLGYTCGKAIRDENFADDIISRGLDELSFSVFSTNPQLRKNWMRDKNPEAAVSALKEFCQNIDVNASVVAIPGINDYQEIYETCSDLEEWGVKTFVLRRFANFKEQGLILNNDQPIIEGITPHTYDEFQELVDKISGEFSFRTLAFPFYDPEKNFPFAILKEKNQGYLKRLPEIEKSATIITGKLAAPFLEKFLKLTGKSSLVNILTLKKDIADLIVPEDLKSADLGEVQENVILPYGALVHKRQAVEILGEDGLKRNIKRGPIVLTHPYYESIDFNQEKLIKYELKSFKELIKTINSF